MKYTNLIVFILFIFWDFNATAKCLLNRHWMDSMQRFRLRLTNETIQPTSAAFAALSSAPWSTQ